jgi:hypothetical protein
MVMMVSRVLLLRVALPARAGGALLACEARAA